ncbi:MAG: hypothetical protein ABI919_07925 [Ramlibacter sp.]
MLDFHVLPTIALSLPALHTAFTTAFADYLIGPFQLSLAQFPQFTARQGVDMALGRIALKGDQIILAFAFVVPRADCPSWPLATMGAVPAARCTATATRPLLCRLRRKANPWTHRAVRRLRLAPCAPSPSRCRPGAAAAR